MDGRPNRRNKAAFPKFSGVYSEDRKNLRVKSLGVHVIKQDSGVT